MNYDTVTNGEAGACARLIIDNEGGPDPLAVREDNVADVARIKAMCRRCPVIEECAKFAIRNELFDGDTGIWGGTTATERRTLIAEGITPTLDVLEGLSSPVLEGLPS